MFPFIFAVFPTKRVTMGKNYYEREQKSATKLHRVIYEMYTDLRREKMLTDPIAARYLGVTYYADIISQHPLIQLTQSTIVRIINSFIRGYRK